MKRDLTDRRVSRRKETGKTAWKPMRPDYGGDKLDMAIGDVVRAALMAGGANE